MLTDGRMDCNRRVSELHRGEPLVGSGESSEARTSISWGDGCADEINDLDPLSSEEVELLAGALSSLGRSLRGRLEELVDFGTCCAESFRFKL